MGIGMQSHPSLATGQHGENIAHKVAFILHEPHIDREEEQEQQSGRNVKETLPVTIVRLENGLQRDGV